MPDLTQAEVEDLFNKDLLVDKIIRTKTKDEKSALINLCANLHNNNAIDLLTICRQPSYQAAKRNGLLSLHIFLQALIPKLKASTQSMMEFVSELVEQGRASGAALLPRAAFLEWCKADLTRADSVISRAISGDTLSILYLDMALHANQNLAQMRSIVNDCDDDRRLKALRALARMEYTNDAERKLTLGLLSSICHSISDDNAKSAILEVITAIYSSNTDEASEECLAIVSHCLDHAAEGTFFQAALMLASIPKGNDSSGKLTTLLLNALKQINSTYDAAVELLDDGLSTLIATRQDEILAFIEFLASRPADPIPPRRFNSCFDAMWASADLLERLFVRWLLSGIPVLCRELDNQIGEHDAGSHPLNIHFDKFGLSGHQIYFVSRKAIGYLFSEPIVAASILVSALRTEDIHLQTAIEELLFDPLLVNYGGALPKYLATIAPDDSSYRNVRNSLASAAAYLEGLKSVGVINELHPSEYHSELEQSRWTEEFNQGFRKAEQRSVLLNLVKKSAILYGKSSVTFVNSPGQAPRPVGIPLRSHEIAFSLPRALHIDPIGLEIRLALFRAEALKQ